MYLLPTHPCFLSSTCTFAGIQWSLSPYIVYSFHSNLEHLDTKLHDPSRHFIHSLYAWKREGRGGGRPNLYELCFLFKNSENCWCLLLYFHWVYHLVICVFPSIKLYPLSKIPFADICTTDFFVAVFFVIWWLCLLTVIHMAASLFVKICMSFWLYSDVAVNRLPKQMAYE